MGWRDEKENNKDLYMDGGITFLKEGYQKVRIERIRMESTQIYFGGTLRLVGLPDEPRVPY